MSRFTITLFLALVLLSSVSARFLVKHQEAEIPVRRCGGRLMEFLEAVATDCPKHPLNDEVLSFRELIVQCCIEAEGCSADQVRAALC